MKQFCMKIDLIFQGRENELFLPSNMAAMTSRENAVYRPTKIGKYRIFSFHILIAKYVNVFAFR